MFKTLGEKKSCSKFRKVIEKRRHLRIDCKFSYEKNFPIVIYTYIFSSIT